MTARWNIAPRFTLATINAHRPNPTVKCHSRNLVLRLSKPKNFPPVVMHGWESHSTQNDRVVSDFVDTCITKRIAGRNCIIRLWWYRKGETVRRGSIPRLPHYLWTGSHSNGARSLYGPIFFKQKKHKHENVNQSNRRTQSEKRIQEQVSRFQIRNGRRSG